jgi:imidazolonepropionase-like amidohydrolase
MKRTLFVWLVGVFATAAAAQEQPHAFVGARIIPIEGAEITSGTLVIHEGKIVAIGASDGTAIPAGAIRHDATGKVLMPGLVDTHSHIGGGAGADSSGPIQPDVRVMDALNVMDPSIRKAKAGGVTTVNVMPGSGHLLSGQTIYLKLRNGKLLDDYTIRDANGRIAGGLKLANGTNAMRSTPGFPGTRAKSAALLRAQFVKAQEYRDKLRKANGDPEKTPARDLAMEALGEVLDGRRVVHFHTHRHDDVMTVLRIAKEFGFRPVLQHVSEGWKVADQIAAAGVPASIIMIDSPGGKLETQDLSLGIGAVMEKAGVLVGFHTDDGITDSRHFLRSAGLAVRGGMSRSAALEAMTLAGARMLQMESRIGSLKPGKDADFIVLSGEPLSVYTKVLETWVEGEKVFDRENPEDRLFAVGGWGAGYGGALLMHHHELEGELD